MRQRARGIDRAFEIINYLHQVGSPCKPNEISTALNAPKSTIYELINVLTEQKILENFEDSGNVFLGRKFYFWGKSYSNHFSIIREAEPFLEELSEITNETSQLCVLEDNKYIVLSTKESRRPFKISTDIGQQIPIPFTASGRLIVSHLSDKEILALIPQQDFSLPNGNQLDPQTFIKQVRQSETLGFFSFDSVVDTFAHCFAAAVLDENKQCIATLCLVVPKQDAISNYDFYKETLINSSQSFSAKLNAESQHK